MGSFADRKHCAPPGNGDRIARLDQTLQCLAAGSTDPFDQRFAGFFAGDDKTVDEPEMPLEFARDGQ